MRRAVLAVAMTAALSACATGPSSFPVQTIRYHYDPVADRGTVSVDPLPGPTAPPIETTAYLNAVKAELTRLGYTVAPAGSNPQFLATVTFQQASRPLPPRRAPVSIGLGVGGFSGGGYRGGGFGSSAAVGFPVGGSGPGYGLATQLSVRIRRGPDNIWEGNAQSLTDARGPGGTTDAIAGRLARALFAGFPGESGRTVEVK